MKAELTEETASAALERAEWRMVSAGLLREAQAAFAQRPRNMAMVETRRASTDYGDSLLSLRDKIELVVDLT